MKKEKSITRKDLENLVDFIGNSDKILLKAIFNITRETSSHITLICIVILIVILFLIIMHILILH